MTTHAIDRLNERYHLNVSSFNLFYKRALAKKEFFKRIYESPFHENSFSICIRINIKIMIIVLNEKTGKIITFGRPRSKDYEKARQLGWLL